MQIETKSWTYNISEYVFHVKNLNFAWLTTWYGILGVIVFFGGGLLLTRIQLKRTLAASKSAEILQWINFVLVSGLGLIIVLFALNYYKIDWGLRWYSTMYVLGYIQMYMLCSYWIKHKKIMLSYLMLDSLVAYLFIGMLLGARTFYVFVYNWKYYSSNLGDLFKIWHGGLSFHGGIVGVIIAIIIYCRQYKIPFFHLTDKLVLTVPFGIAMGRIGNFLNGGELFGRIVESNVPWAVVFPQGGPMPRHPSQLYQSIGEGWLLLLTLFLLSRKKYREGVLSVAFIFFYALYRFPVEYFREADEQLRYFFNNTLTMGQILCLLTMFVAGIVFSFTRNNIIEGCDAWRKRMDDFFVAREAMEQQELNSGKSSKTV